MNDPKDIDINAALLTWLKERVARYKHATLNVSATDDMFIAVVQLSEKKEVNNET